MKSTWIIAAALTMIAAFANAQTPPPESAPTAATAIPAAPPPVATPPVVGVNNGSQPTMAPQPNFTHSTGPSAPPSLSPAVLQAIQAQQRQMMRQQMNPPSSNGFSPSSNGFQPSFGYSGNANANTNTTNAQEGQKSEIVAVLPPADRAPELRAVLRTSVGDITIRLDRVNAPLTVEYFTGLAKGEIEFTDVKTSKPVKRPFYNGLIFHRAVKNTLIQTGDPFGNGRGNSGHTVPDEIKPTMKFDRPGMVAIAPMRESKGTAIARGTNSSQFFITLREMPEWNGQFTIFGEVEDGLDVVQKIANSKVGPTERPIKRIYLVAVDILESAK
jgi:peptidyl-prolyl cis-trans isomerase A (cyclophilin A)